jgi:hypothetical protein
MKLYLQPIPSLLFSAFCTYVAGSWFRWARSARDEGPKWQPVVAVVGFSFATVSTILSAFLYIHAVFTGGYTFYHPVELFCIRVGTLTALVGLIATALGKGKLRLPGVFVSLLNLLVWFIDAMAQ